MQRVFPRMFSGDHVDRNRRLRRWPPNSRSRIGSSFDRWKAAHSRRGQVRIFSRPCLAGQTGQGGPVSVELLRRDDGALIGTHKVSITAGEGLSPTQTRWYAPKKFADYRTSGLTQEITGPTDNLVINISWDGGHEFVEREQGGSGDNEGLHGRRRAKAKAAE